CSISPYLTVDRRNSSQTHGHTHAHSRQAVLSSARPRIERDNRQQQGAFPKPKTPLGKKCLVVVRLDIAGYPSLRPVSSSRADTFIRTLFRHLAMAQSSEHIPDI
ncbi:unnamed protein product, partial [Ectocarpus fasciculatus]